MPIDENDPLEHAGFSIPLCEKCGSELVYAVVEINITILGEYLRWDIVCPICDRERIYRPEKEDF